MATGTSSNTFPTVDRTHAMSAVLAQNWWAVALRGVFAILFGLVALLMPGVTMLSLIWFFAAYMLVDGVFTIVAAVKAASNRQRWGLLILEGIVDIAVGIIMFASPGLSVVVFVLLMGSWSLVTGIIEIIAAFKLNSTHGRGWLIFSGVVSILFGIALLVGPLVGAVVLTWWLGAYAMVFGITLLVLGFKLKSRRDSEPLTHSGQAA